MNIKSNMKLSIITPNFNYGHYISQTIKSVISQKYNNIEHIIIDDGSTDNSRKIVDEFKEKYPEIIKTIYQPNQGQTKAINAGFRIASGDIIGWINSDDFYCGDILDFVTKYFLMNKDVDLIFGDIYKVDSNGVIISKKKYLPFDFEAGCFLGFGNLIANNAAFFRSSLLERTGLLDENLSYVMDSDLWFRFGKAAKIKKVEKIFGCFRMHEEAKSNKKKNFENEMAPLLQKYYKYCLIGKYLPYSIGRNFKYYYKLKRFLLLKIDRTS